MTPGDDGRVPARWKRPKELLWQERRAQLIAQLTPVLGQEYPHLTPRSLRVIVEKRADVNLLYDRFGLEP